ncbi:hypothetical protein NC652_005095 [Populus alba x Populus x berolinensis]|nr:hypothetical protein NC652_005095 [Populus alba x Populus x berolinensis]
MELMKSLEEKSSSTNRLRFPRFEKQEKFIFPNLFPTLRNSGGGEILVILPARSQTMPVQLQRCEVRLPR